MVGEVLIMMFKMLCNSYLTRTSDSSPSGNSKVRAVADFETDVCAKWGHNWGWNATLRFPLRYCLVPVSSKAYQGVTMCKISWFGDGWKEELNMALPSLVAQTVKHLPAMWETWVWSLGWEDPLEKEMATHSSTLA